MPHPSNIPGRTGNGITNPTIYLFDWRRQIVPGINGTQTAPVQSGDPVAILELISGSWRKIANPENFVDILSDALGVEAGNLNGRIGAISRLCEKIWISSETGRLFSSFDAGKTWELNSQTNAGSDNYCFTDYDVTGRLWRYDDGAAIYRSNSGNGDDWELLYNFSDFGFAFFTSPGGAFPAGRGIVCHKRNKNIVAVPVVDHGDDSGFDIAKCIISIDDGNSFYIVTLPIQPYVEFPSTAWGIYDVTFTDSGRLIVAFENFENEEPFENRFLASYTDDYENFVLTELLPEVRTGHFGFQCHLEEYENLVFAIFTRDHAAGFSPVGIDALIVHLARSTDNGETYEELTRFVNLNNGINPEFPAYPQGIIYDPASQLLYCFFTSLDFDTEGLPFGSTLHLQTVDSSGNKAIAEDLVAETGLEIPYPLRITAAHRKISNLGSSTGENVPKGFTRGNPSNLPLSISSCG